MAGEDKGRDAALLHILGDLDGPRRQWDAERFLAVFSVFQAREGNRPNGLVEIELLPLRFENRVRPDIRQNEKFEGARRHRFSGVQRRNKFRHLSVWQRRMAAAA